MYLGELIWQVPDILDQLTHHCQQALHCTGASLRQLVRRYATSLTLWDLEDVTLLNSKDWPLLR